MDPAPARLAERERARERRLAEAQAEERPRRMRSDNARPQPARDQFDTQEEWRAAAMDWLVSENERRVRVGLRPLRGLYQGG